MYRCLLLLSWGSFFSLTLARMLVGAIGTVVGSIADPTVRYALLAVVTQEVIVRTERSVNWKKFHFDTNKQAKSGWFNNNENGKDIHKHRIHSGGDKWRLRLTTVAGVLIRTITAVLFLVALPSRWYASPVVAPELVLVACIFCGGWKLRRLITVDKRTCAVVKLWRQMKFSTLVTYFTI